MRQFARLGAVAAATIGLALSAPALVLADTTRSHGISAFGDLAYAPGFPHFDYVNPEAPKGGRIVLRPTKGPRTFDNFNPYITRGDGADLSELLFDTLMVRAYDHPDALYGLVAESVELPPDRSYAIFHLRPEARFSDGSRLTAEDVVFSLISLRNLGRPSLAIALKPVETVTAIDARTVRVDFTEGAPTRDLPALVASMPIFSAADFATRAFDEPNRGQAPLGSGPYRVGEFDNGSYVIYQRRDDYWAKDLPARVGKFNFDQIRLQYYTDADVALESFKAGDIDLNEEFRSLNWATKYEFPAVNDGRVVKETLEDGRAGGTQGFWLNTRREKFADPRVREAIGLAFDFEWSNSRLFYGLYTRTDSFFENSLDLQASGAATPEEIALLEPFRAALSPAVFEEPAYTPPTSNGSGQDRRLLRRARNLLKEAGWTVQDGQLQNAAGQPLSVEFLEIANANFDRIAKPFLANLRSLGIEATLRSVDPAQFEERVKQYDYDMIVRRFVPGDTPGPAVRGLLSSEAANQPGSYNLAGVSSPAIDALLDAIDGAASREELRVASHALDRVFRAGHYWVPNWYKGSHTIAYWDRFGRPMDMGIPKPPYDRGVIATWWVDAEKAEKIDATR